MEATEFILYVADQAKATAFYRHVLAAEPVLDVPGMTEFNLGGATLGLMPAADMEDLLAGQIRGGTGQRCELYLRRTDAAATLARAAAGGGKLLDGLRDRSWGERVGYALDPDGHVLALAVPAGPSWRTPPDRLVLTGVHRQAACRLPRPKTGWRCAARITERSY